MIVVRIIGGLGNQIAQYAYGRQTADRLGVPLKLDITGFERYPLRSFALDRFSLRAEIASAEDIAQARSCRVVSEGQLIFDPAIDAQVIDGAYLDGYWGDYRYAHQVLDALRQDFQPRAVFNPASPGLLEDIRGRASLSLHVRRGDYVTNPNCFVMPLSYYEDALRLAVARIPDLHVFVFSDDLDWVATHLQLPVAHTFVRGNDQQLPIDDFQLMRCCRHHILANSSFSFWAALLGSTDGLTIAPQQYFRTDDPWMLQNYGGIHQPVWPRHWTVLPIRRPEAHTTAYLGIAGGHAGTRRMSVGMWNYYEEITTAGFLFRNANVNIGANLLKPWCDLHAYGAAHGIDFVTLDQVADLASLDAMIFMDRPRPGHPLVEQVMDLPIPRYLCLFETEVVKPDNWDSSYHTRFDRIFTWNDALIDDRRVFKQNLATDPESPYDFEVLKSAFLQRRLCTLIASAKGAQHPNELYSERVRAIQWFQQYAPQDFDFYGMGWSGEGLRCYGGAVADKLAVLSGYRFAICYENARNYAGYITEKIFDCFKAGVVPVYLGAPNIGDWVPADCFIDRRAFGDMQQLHGFLAGMDQATHNGYLDRIRAFLASPRSYPFSTEYFITSLTALLARDVLARRGDQPDVTVVIPTYNSARFLELSVGTALREAVEKLEVLVLDNASTDNTREVLASFGSHPRLRVMRNTRNIGAPLNWRNGHAIATGRYLTVLSADDFYLPGFLVRALHALETNPGTALAYCPCIWVKENAEPIGVLNHVGHAAADHVGGRNEPVELLTHDCYITPSAAVIRRSALDRVGQIDIALHGATDWDLWIRLATATPDFVFFKSPLACYRVHDAQDTKHQQANAYTLIDHIEIVRKAAVNGLLRVSAPQRDAILDLLRRRYASFPGEQVAHLQGKIAALHWLLNGG